ncbi:MAG: DUF5011 domain-containing protein [Candidatus Hydrogenedentes bacterium]|nr:DUF5011 domain-containing protein [Candidatus Hydrogenedentota bacterium]
MKNIHIRGVLLVAVLGVTLGMLPAQAHPYMVGDHWSDFSSLANQAQTIMDAMMTEYVGCNLWSTNCAGSAIWTSVVGQRGPGWVPVGGYTADHGAGRWGVEPTFVRTDYHWAFLEEALKVDACMEGVPPARIQAIRNAFNANKNRVLTTEITLYGVNISADVLGCDNDFTRNITTGGSISLGIEGGPFCPTVYTINEGIPSLFSTANGGPLLDEAHPLLRDMLANMTAAYMTIGDSRVVNYWYAFMGRLGLTFVQELLPGILDSIGKSDKSENADLGAAVLNTMAEAINGITLNTEKTDKAFGCVPWGDVNPINISKTVSGLPVIGSVTVYVNIADSNICLSLRNFADKFNCASYTCLPDYLAVQNAQGDLNADGRSNLASWFLAANSLQEWKILEGAGGYLDIINQPVSAAAPVNYGGSYGLNVTGASSAPISYQWYAGYSPASLVAVPGATTRDYMSTIDVYSFNGTNMYKYYQVVLSATYCGAPHTVVSDIVSVQGGTPPGIGIDEHPVGGNYFPGEIVNLTVKAGVIAGTGLSYQWQKYNNGTSAWDNVPGATSAVLTFSSIAPADAGQYRVQVLNQVPPSPVYWVFSNSATINVAPGIIFNPQPQGAELTIGADHTMNVGASVSVGSLEYRWQRNSGFGFQDLIPWSSAGGLSFTSSWDVTDAQIGDAGTYRCQVRNTHPIFGQYVANSDDAVITISSGTVFRVDKYAPGTVQDGLSWATAFKTIQPAINAAAAAPGGGEVWVAGGPLSGSPNIYNEARTELWGGVTGSLIIKNNVQVYGGFEGYRGGLGAQEQYRDQRVIPQNRAIIDGSISRGGAPAYHVIVFGSETAPTVNAAIDGFIIQGGNASGNNTLDINHRYHTWRGGGIYNWLSSPTIANCRILNNTAAVSGGAIANEAYEIGGTFYPANATLLNCIIETNTASRLADGGAGPGGGNPIRGGGGVFNNGATPSMRFLTLRANHLGAFTPPVEDVNNWGIGSGGILDWGMVQTPAGAITIDNSILWDNDEGPIDFGKALGCAATFAVDFANLPDNHVQGGWTAGTISTADPLLTAESDLQVGSPAVNTGDPGITAGQYTDRRGVPRPVGARVDRGAVEQTLNGPVPACGETSIDFTITPKITDLSDVYVESGTTSEAPIWKVALEDKTFDCNAIPQDDIRVTVTDILGRSAFCDATVWVTETEPPVPVANPAFTTITLNAAGEYTLTNDDVWNIGDTSLDNCYVTSISVVPSLFRCSQAGGSVYVTLLVMDNSGNPAAKSILLDVDDGTDPTAVCGTLDVELDQFGQYVLSQDEIAVLGGKGVPPAPDTTTDPCGIAWGYTTAGRTAFDCDDVGITFTVPVTVWDNHGNAATCGGTINVYDVTPPAIAGVLPQTFARSMGDYPEATALAGVTAMDSCSGDVTASLTVEAFDESDNPVPFPVPANFDMGGAAQHVFRLVYTATDTSANPGVTETTLTLYNMDLPVITMNGSAHIVHECGAEYIDPGATAWDPNAGVDVTDLMQTSIPVDKFTVGTYVVTYFINFEEYNLLVQEQRTVEVVDSLPPVITLQGNAEIVLSVGGTYTEPGVTVYDQCSWDLLPEDVIIGGDVVDTNTIGVYTITYDVTDGFWDAEQKTRTVYVGDVVRYTQQPQSAKLYTTSPPYDVTAGYERGVAITGYQWYRDMVGLGTVEDTTVPNNVAISVDPATHAQGITAYNLRVYDDIFGDIVAYESNTAAIEVRPPLSALGLDDVTLVEGDAYDMSVSASGGFGNRTYQWYRIDPDTLALIPLADGGYPNSAVGPGFYAGTETATLKFTPYTEAMAGQYQVEIMDAVVEDANGTQGGLVVVGPVTVTNGISIPVAGALTLGVLALSIALGGATALRKRK